MYIFLIQEPGCLAQCLLFCKELPARMLVIFKCLGKTGQTTPSHRKSKYENAILQTSCSSRFIFGVCGLMTFLFWGGGGDHSHLWFPSMLGSPWNNTSIKLLAKCHSFCSFQMPLVFTLGISCENNNSHTLCNYLLIINNLIIIILLGKQKKESNQVDQM